MHFRLLAAALLASAFCSCAHQPIATRAPESLATSEHLQYQKLPGVRLQFSSLPSGGSDKMDLRILRLNPPMFLDLLGGTIDPDFIRGNIDKPDGIRAFSLDLRGEPKPTAAELITILKLFTSTRQDGDSVDLVILGP